MCRAGVSCAQLGLGSAAAETLSVDVRISASPPKNCRLFYAILSRRTELRLLLRWRWHVLSCLVHLVLPEATLEAMDSSSWSLTHHTLHSHTTHAHIMHSSSWSLTHHTQSKTLTHHTRLCGRPRALACSHPRTHSIVHALTCSLTHSLTPSVNHSYSLLHSLRKDNLHMWGYPVL